MKHLYQAPHASVFSLAEEDIIRTSGEATSSVTTTPDTPESTTPGMNFNDNNGPGGTTPFLG